MRQHLFRSLALLTVAVGIATPARASLITYQFTATVTEIAMDRTGRVAASGVSVGSALLGTVAWDNDGGTCFNSSCTAFYNRDAPLSWFTLTYGSFMVGGGAIQIIETDPSGWSFQWPGDIHSTVGSIDSVYIFLGSSDGRTVPLGDAPLKSFDPTVFNSGTLSAAGVSYNPNATDFRATISNVRAVPEPASLLLLGMGLAGAALARWRRRRP